MDMLDTISGSLFSVGHNIFPTSGMLETLMKDS